MLSSPVTIFIGIVESQRATPNIKISKSYTDIFTVALVFWYILEGFQRLNQEA